MSVFFIKHVHSIVAVDQIAQIYCRSKQGRITYNVHRYMHRSIDFYMCRSTGTGACTGK